MRMYTNKRLYSVIASLAAFKERFRVAAGCNTKNARGDRASTHFNHDQDSRNSGLDLLNGKEAAATAPPGVWC